jgi:hypothetical protein
MRQQTKPFTVEIRQSRKLKPASGKPSIWGTHDLSIEGNRALSSNPKMEEAPAESEELGEIF